MTTLSERRVRARRFPRTRTGRRVVQSSMLLVADLAIIALATWIAMLGRDTLTIFRNADDIQQNVLPVAGAFVVVWLLCLTAAGSYQFRRVGVGSGEFNSVLVASLLAAATVGVGAYLTAYDLSRGFYVLLFAIGTPLLLLERLLMRRLVLHRLRENGVLSTPAILVGDTGHVDELARTLGRARWLGYQVAGVLTPDGEPPVTPGGHQVFGTVHDVVHALEETNAHLVIFTEGAFPEARSFNRLARQLEDRDAQLCVVPALTDVSAARMNMRPVAGLPLVYVESPRATAATRWSKRAFDIVGSSIALLLAGPLMLAIALAIKLEDRGPAMFTQTRAGLKGKPFTCYKFRSMVVDAEDRLAKLRAAADAGNDVLFKMERDPRVTRVGRFIRRFSLDELPQLFNVLKGEMSLIGPRPALPREVELYQKHVHRRLDVRPGLTGLWQVSGRSDLSWEDTVRLDLYYVDNWSLLQDLNILARTVGAVISSRGAY